MELSSCYKQTDAGMIPEEWEAISIFDLSDRRKELFDDGDWIEAEYLTSSGIRLIQTGNIGEGQFTDKESKKYISEESFKKLGCKALQVGDLLICRLAEPAGRACILPYIGEERIITAVDVTIFRPPSSLADRRYLVNVFSTPRWFQFVNERCGGSTRTRIARGELGKIKIPLPPIPEQRAIAEALGDMDALLGALDRIIAKKCDLKQAAMQQLLTGQTRLPGFHGEWQLKRLGDVADIRSGGTPSTAEALFWDGDVPWCTPTDITALHGYKYLGETSRMITQLGLKASSAEMIPAHSIVMTSRATIGECAINTVPVSTNQGFKNFIPFQTIDVDFLYYLLTTQKHGFISLCGGSTFLEIGKTQLVSYQVRLPASKDEQAAIGKILSDMDAELSALEQRRNKTRDLKQAMMQELLTGRTRLV
ncbi:MAG: hypothetical protein HOP03_13585 [Lysobacter sp.]|nr:hypothetical protein [Lysobacter sp.]